MYNSPDFNYGRIKMLNSFWKALGYNENLEHQQTGIEPSDTNTQTLNEVITLDSSPESLNPIEQEIQSPLKLVDEELIIAACPSLQVKVNDSPLKLDLIKEQSHKPCPKSPSPILKHVEHIAKDKPMNFCFNTINLDLQPKTIPPIAVTKDKKRIPKRHGETRFLLKSKFKFNSK